MMGDSKLTFDKNIQIYSLVLETYPYSLHSNKPTLIKS
jgi:hypothetical protein